MELKEYFDTYGIKISTFCKKLGKSTPWIYRIMNGAVPKAADALLIEQLTEGKVTKEELLFPKK